jgi:hypothetical protein
MWQVRQFSGRQKTGVLQMLFEVTRERLQIFQMLQSRKQRYMDLVSILTPI